ncbi:MAG: HIT family protein, partial [Phycisphaeraceae bacterium]
TLVIPKAHYATIDTMPDALAGACMAVIPKLSRAILKTTQADGWNVLQNNHRVAGQAVDHVHLHIIPRVEGDGLGYRWPAGKLDDAAAKQLREQITESL